MSHSSIHFPNSFWHNTANTCSMASAVHLCALNPYEFGSALISATGYSARQYSPCIDLSYIVGIEIGLRFLFDHFFGMYILHIVLALYPLALRLNASFIFATPVLYNLPSIPAVFDPLELVTFLTANILAEYERVSSLCKALTLPNLLCFVAFAIRICS